MDLGWAILLIFMLFLMLLVVLLILPMPNNEMRGAITKAIGGLWNNKAFKGVYFALLAFDIFYFCFVCDSLLHPLYDFGLIMPPEFLTCQQKATMYQNERLAFATGFSVFLAFVLNRLIDIQTKLHQMRGQFKNVSQPGGVPGGVPMGVPMGKPVESHHPHSQ